MLHHTRTLRAGIILSLLVLASLAFALYPSLSNSLIGANGLSSGGQIRVDQSKLPSQPARCEVRLNNVALPNGTVLGVSVDGQFFGTISVSNSQSQGTIYTYLMTGRNARVYITLEDGTVVAYQLGSWKV